MIELKNFDDSKVPEKDVIKFWKDLYRLNQNENVVCCGAAMYVSDTTEFQPSALEFARTHNIPTLYEKEVQIEEVVERLIQNLKEAEQRVPLTTMITHM